MKRVVITGIGCLTPIGNNPKEVYQALLNQTCGIDEIKSFDTSDLKVKLAAEVKGLTLEDYLDFKEIKNNDRFTQFAKIAAKQAILDSKLDLNQLNKSRFGCIMASGIGGLSTIEDTAKTMFERGPSRISPYFIPKALINISAGCIAIDFGCQGYVSSTVTACAAGTNAIGDAFLRIAMGLEDVMISGGSEACICKLGIGGFQAMKALSCSVDKNRASIPFDAQRNGFVMGEGAGVLILEELEHALARGATIYAEIVGYGCSCDAHHITAPMEDGSMGALAMTKALSMANISPSDIGYFNAHGTSTHLNDLTETKAIHLAFKESASQLAISSTKGNTGHLLGASGAVESIFTILSLKKGIIFPTINYQCIDEECDLNYMVNGPQTKEYDYAMKNSLGFGGHNAALIFKKWRNI